MRSIGWISPLTISGPPSASLGPSEKINKKFWEEPTFLLYVYDIDRIENEKTGRGHRHIVGPLPSNDRGGHTDGKVIS
jgi:hypothetical protein